MIKIINFWICVSFLLFGSLCLADTGARPTFPIGNHDVFIASQPDLDFRSLKKIAPLVQSSIANGYYPGAVILASHRGQIIYRGVFGNQRIIPDVYPMRFDTLFDVASLTKVIVTTTAIMQLVEHNQLKLDESVAHYWPSFGANGKSNITLRDLLTHTSGLPADFASPELNMILPAEKFVPNAKSWHGKVAALQQIIALKPIYPPRSRFIYSDINFIILGYLVERVSGESLDQYAKRHIFDKSGMNHSTFLPSHALRSRIAPTQLLAGKLRWGDVHDPTANLMGGVAGMAGLFSDAHDLGVFADTLLNNGRVPGRASVRLLTPSMVTMMTTPQTPSAISEVRGLGWDINSPFACRGRVFSAASYGHTGWTGTSIWIDPVSQTWLIILTSRTHPQPARDNILIADRSSIADLVARAVI